MFPLNNLARRVNMHGCEMFCIIVVTAAVPSNSCHTFVDVFWRYYTGTGHVSKLTRGHLLNSDQRESSHG